MEGFPKIILAGLYIAALGISVSGAVCLLAAPFSKRIRDSISRRPIAHAAWFVIGFIFAFDVVWKVLHAHPK